MIASSQVPLLVKEVWIPSENPEDRIRNGRLSQLTNHRAQDCPPSHTVGAHLSQRGGGHPKGGLRLRLNFNWWRWKPHPKICISQYLWCCSILDPQKFLLWEGRHGFTFWVTYLTTIGGNFQAKNLYWVSVTWIKVDFLPSLWARMFISTIDSCSHLKKRINI